MNIKDKQFFYKRKENKRKENKNKNKKNFFSHDDEDFFLFLKENGLQKTIINMLIF